MPQAALAAPARRATLDRLERESFDCAVIGGGISGAGVALEAARRGLSVALLEAEDYASGTSSRSTRLVHGGLRYLAMGDFGLVRTTARERVAILRLAPHLAEPRWLVVPARGLGSLLLVRAGVTLYERLGAVVRADRHRIWSREELEREEPALDAGRYPHACVYREYLTDDAHLVIANLRAAVAHGAAVMNHARVHALVLESGRAAGVEVRCGISGRAVRVRARAVVNAAGPWVDAVRRMEDPRAAALLHLSSGIHVVLPAERLPVRNMLLLRTSDRRRIFAIRHGEVTYAGTTDSSYEPGAAVWPTISLEDVRYLLDALSASLRVAPLRAEEVVSAWAGLRPLVAEPGKATRELSRREEVQVGPAGMVSVAGGKLTGYRPMAREVLDPVLRVGGLRPGPAPREEQPLPGGDFDGALGPLAQRLVRDHGISRVCADRIARLYGSEAHEVARAGVQPLVSGAPVLASEVDRAVLVEGAARLEDTIYRRLRTAHFVPEARESALEPAADRMAALLDWSDEERAKQIDSVRGRLAADLEFRARRE